uniref:J domain-containing protein n=1 Tax=Cannabis sativa TaxID=3483 RepID=A0A803QJ88_CANSA
MSAMECNKEEAVRAMGLAEKKMHSNDFPGAHKIAQKAQRLFPDLENISQLLAVCEVHCSAQVKVGTEKDWYKILQIEQTVDGATIKKQYRKLALLLHPDKNKFAGAEAAFKLIGEANMVLSDQAKRSGYDMKYRVVNRTKPSASIHQSNVGTYAQQQYGASVNLQNFPRAQYAHQYPYQQAQPTFWTCCPFCSVRYQYYKAFVNKLLVCQSCQKNYVAHDMGVQGAPPRSVRAPFPNHGPPIVPSQCNIGNFSDERSPNSFPRPPQMPKAGPAAKPSRQSKVDEKDTKAPVTKQRKSKKSGSSEHTNRKRGRRFVEESSESHDTEAETEDVYNNNVFDSSKLSEVQNRRRSSRQKQNISYKDNLSDDDDFVSPPKRSKVTTSSSSGEEDNENSFVNGGTNKVDESHKEESMQFDSFADKDRFPSEKSDDSSELTANETSDSEHFTCPDPEFSDFEEDKKKNCFAVNQIWACYDPVDAMPRYYAQIRNVLSSKFEIRWLESAPDDKMGKKWVKSKLPVACGRYKLKGYDEVDLTMFSHQMYSMNGTQLIRFVYPRKGETWALFQNWDINWSSDPKKQLPFQYEYVEIQSDFTEGAGVSVAFLGRVKGFTCLFQLINETAPFQIPPNELYRFSHRIPSFRMTGDEREDVPKGSYEFDPASLPPSFFKVCDEEDVKMDNNVTPADQLPVSGMSENNSKSETLISRKSPRKCNGNDKASGSQSTFVDTVKNEINQGNVTASNGSATVPQADEKIKTPMKQGINHDIDFKLRRSPRDLTKKSESVSNHHSNSEKVENSDSSSRAQFNNGNRVKNNSFQECCDFTQERSQENFKHGQIWAVRTDENVFPKTYAKVTRIETTPEFQVHVALLELCSTLKGAIQSVSCGTFQVKSGVNKPFPLSAFSHCLNVKASSNKYEIYPRKGEIWAMLKNQHNEQTSKLLLDIDYDIVEVMEEHDQSVQVAILIQVAGFKSMFKAPRIQRSKTGLLDIPRDKMGKFSHQIPAVQHTGEKDSRLAGCWELDPLSLPRSLISLD